MFLRSRARHKDGKTHRYWSIVENRRVRGNRVVQRQVLYLGEINDSQQAAWSRTIEVFADGQDRPRQMALFPEGRSVPVADSEVVQVRLGDLELRRPRQWGGCWLAALSLLLDAACRGRGPRGGFREARVCRPRYGSGQNGGVRDIEFRPRKGGTKCR